MAACDRERWHLAGECIKSHVPRRQDASAPSSGCAHPAAKARARANDFSGEHREALIRRGMSLIYGGDNNSQVKAHSRRG